MRKNSWLIWVLVYLTNKSRLPNILHAVILYQLLFKISWYFPKKERIKPHFRIKFCIRWWMTSCIDLPPNINIYIEVTLDIVRANHDVIENVIISSAGFVMFNPATIDKEELFLANQGLHNVFNFICLGFIPLWKIINVWECKFARFVFLKGFYNWWK